MKPVALRLPKGLIKPVNVKKNETTKKTKIDFVIGVFFDGTGNNRYNSDLVYYKNLDKNHNVILENYKKTRVRGENKNFMADTDSSYWNPYSNVALLHDLYITGKKNNTIYIRQYVQGIGTLEKEEDDILGSGFGIYKRGVIGKVQEACDGIAEKISKELNKNKTYAIGSLTFDVYGFSRGAAAARHFCNELIGKSSVIGNFNNKKEVKEKDNRIVKIDNTRVDSKDFFIPVSQTYTLGMLGIALKEEKIAYNYVDSFTTSKDNEKVVVRFLGLFDTVVSQFISKYYGDFNLDELKEYNKLVKPKNLQEANIDISKLAIQRVLHLSAGDEWRENFPLTKTNIGISLELLGAHSDIGGGYAAIQKEITKIHLFKVITGTSIDDINNPKIGNKEKEIRSFFIKRGYCEADKIDFKKIGEITKKIDNFTNAVHGVILKLESERNIKPRYSVIPLEVMKYISQKAGVPFSNKIEDIKTNEPEFQKRPFEYEVPKDIIKYLEVAKEFAEKRYELLYNKREVQTKHALTDELILKIRKEYVHLSSHFNKPAFTIPIVMKEYYYNVIYNANEEEFINKMAYINHPRESNKKSTPNEREILLP